MTEVSNTPPSRRRVAFIIEADVDYRADDPDYCLSVARTSYADLGSEGRIHHIELVDAFYANELATWPERFAAAVVVPDDSE